MKKIIVFVSVFAFMLTPFFAFAADVTEEPREKAEETEQTPDTRTLAETSNGNDLSALYGIIDELKQDLTDSKQTESYTERFTEQRTKAPEEHTAERKTQPETTADRSAPRLMVTYYSLDSGFLSPGKQGKLIAVLKNTNRKRAVSNLKVTLTDDSGELMMEKMNTRFIGTLGAGKSYTLEVILTANHSAAVGRHSVTVTSEYEDSDFQSYSSSDTLYVDVRQNAELSFSGAELPAEIVEGETLTITLTLMNTGKSQLSNCRADFDVKGLLSGGTAFCGELAPGESKVITVNLRAEPDNIGKTKGIVTVQYEDEHGKEYKKTAGVSTEIEKKVEVATAPAEEKEEALPRWLFGAGGLLLGGGAAFVITYSVFAAKQRKQDELRL